MATSSRAKDDEVTQTVLSSEAKIYQCPNGKKMK
jgi:hypothetical protein